MMLIKKTLSSKYAQTGVTLVELMISIALGLLLLTAATAMTVSSMVMNADTLSSARLNQNLDSVMQIMVNDIRRAGYSKNITAGQPAVVFADNQDLNIFSPSCVLYAYNANEDADLNPEEMFGFKLVGSEIHMRTRCPEVGTSVTSACSTSCTAGTWVALTDDDIVSISGLSFNSLNSKCISITETKNYWVSKNDTSTKFPCMSDAIAADLDMYVIDASGDYDLDVTTTLPGAVVSEVVIGTRQVNVQITAELVNDPSMQKSQRVAINVRNNHIRTTP